ncbi:MAG: VWA domain-containing protein [Bacilli bacterium]|nr:VWA domain-containing protein [Bacilli bacterium]
MSENNPYFGDDDLVTNTSNRVPFCVCVDISGSMAKTDPTTGKKPIEELNTFINELHKYIRESNGLVDSVEFAIVTFNSEFQVVRDFALCKEEDPEVNLEARGGTALAHGVNLALDILEQRKLDFKNNHVDYFQPVLVLVTDGKPGDQEDLPATAQRTSEAANNGKLAIFPVVIGSDNDEAKWREITNILSPLSPKHAPMHLRGLQFDQLMDFLVKSMEQLVISNPDDGKPVATADPDAGGGWGTW